MSEIVLEFGPAGKLVGVLSRPADFQNAGPADVAVVITNAGIIHRVGANRLHVRLARYLADRGYPCLRYDLPGIGDSERLGVGDETQENLTATRAALDRLLSMGVARRFVMVGLCSGADHSLVATVVDPRIAGAVMIDPTTVFSTRRHRINLLLRRVGRGLMPRFLWRVVTGRSNLWRRAMVAVEAEQRGLPHAPDPTEVEARAQAVGALRALVARNARLFMVMTGHSDEVFSYPGQIVDAFPEVEGLPNVLRVDYRPEAEHTFGREADRCFLEAEVHGWLGSLRVG